MTIFIVYLIYVIFFLSLCQKLIFATNERTHTHALWNRIFRELLHWKSKREKEQQDFFFSFASGYVLCADLMSHNHKNSGQEVLCVLALFFYVFWAIVWWRNIHKKVVSLCLSHTGTIRVLIMLRRWRQCKRERFESQRAAANLSVFVWPIKYDAFA